MNNNYQVTEEVQANTGLWGKLGRWFSEHPIAIVGAHAISLAFCVASIANIQTFIFMLDPNQAVAWGLGVALGLALWLMAIFLSSIEEWKSKQFAIVLAVTLSLALISGSIQASSYQAHVSVNEKVTEIQRESMMSLAWWIGYAMPLIGELGVALALAAYLENQRKNMARVIQQNIMEANGKRMVRQINNMSDDVGKEQAIEQLERMTSESYRFLTDQVVSEMESQSGKKPSKKVKPDTQSLPIRDFQNTMKNGIRSVAAKIVSETDATDNSQDVAENGNNLQISEQNSDSEFGSHNLPAANEARQAEMEMRQSAILKLLATFGALGAVAIQKYLQDDFGIVTTERTIRNDMEALCGNGKAIKPSRGVWSLPQPVLQVSEVAAPAFSANGHSH